MCVMWYWIITCTLFCCLIFKNLTTFHVSGHNHHPSSQEGGFWEGMKRILAFVHGMCFETIWLLFFSVNTMKNIWKEKHHQLPHDCPTTVIIFEFYFLICSCAHLSFASFWAYICFESFNLKHWHFPAFPVSL